MSRDHRYIIRRTLSQERFEVLWKKRAQGQATLRDLAEMDEIINRDPGVRRFVLEEMEHLEDSEPNNNAQQMIAQPHVTHQNILARIKALLNRIFHMVNVLLNSPSAIHH
ncbi:hypothetical protein [Mucilaginibacter phyllosphaerae]|uniref:Uncharacterized protein n=1 Tax=Mucilaginibacter phyllosphaerae TaxID=1812349 RepID=A0A4Y8A771_9SPHI|nr:hypothetical protein [Mucilaginibacter phyllosphaerae]MBB3970835.1 hypothetical protein [Mucilaginibacter phyllosphaerae]TEW64228.1 hypothetical protein E2R65_17930 [Mucilaginibacter phyllosphaerae]GGH04891.1 hypothetical protein GCM10007352_08380 [Mucilaginibacter phyllosphaerae]